MDVFNFFQLDHFHQNTEMNWFNWINGMTITALKNIYSNNQTRNVSLTKIHLLVLSVKDCKSMQKPESEPQLFLLCIPFSIDSKSGPNQSAMTTPTLMMLFPHVPSQCKLQIGVDETIMTLLLFQTDPLTDRPLHFIPANCGVHMLSPTVRVLICCHV